VTLDLQYRFYATDDPEFEVNDPDLGKITFESEYMTHNVMAGLRFNF
jgi:opacity protein-like surface antigen